MLTLINANIRRITIPYKDIYTSVFILDTKDGTVLFDTASSAFDAENYILPELRNRDVRYIFISHNHRDHAWGLARLMEVYPKACIVTQNATLTEQYSSFSVLSPEEGTDAQALLDTRSGILLTGDCLQAYGIYGGGQWGACIRAIPEHLAALEKLRHMPITDVLMAHDYHPFGNEVYGTEEIHRCLDICATALQQVKDVLSQNPELSDQEVADLYNRDSGLPTVPAFVPAAIRAAVAEGKL